MCTLYEHEKLLDLSLKWNGHRSKNYTNECTYYPF